jgi:hypothetical protein
MLLRASPLRPCVTVVSLFRFEAGIVYSPLGALDIPAERASPEETCITDRDNQMPFFCEFGP